MNTTIREGKRKMEKRKTEKEEKIKGKRKMANFGWIHFWDENEKRGKTRGEEEEEQEGEEEGEEM